MAGGEAGTLTTSVGYDVPANVAFAYLADPRNRPEWQSSLRAVELLDEGEPHVGMCWRDLTSARIEPEMVITELEPDVQWAETGRWWGIQADLTLGFSPERERLRGGGGTPRPGPRAATTRGLGGHARRPARRTKRPAQGWSDPRLQEGLMGRVVALALSLLMVLAGLVFTFQGLGYLKGSPMTGVDFWAVVGPALAGFGIALGIVALRGPR